jgi:type II secretory pathway pseudopilin PulG
MMKSEKGISLLETILAVAILGIISAAFLGALATTSTARATNEERTSAKILAESIIENIKTENFTTSYAMDTVWPLGMRDKFPGYTPSWVVTNQWGGHTYLNLQKITVTIRHHNHDVLSLESYNVDRTS